MCEHNGNGKTWFINLENTSRNTLGGDRLKYYMQHVSLEQLVEFGMRKNACPVCGLHEIEVGAHVGKLDVNDRHAYLLPLCSNCNQREEAMSLLYQVEFVKVPGNTEGFSEITYPQLAIHAIKIISNGALNAWNGKPMP